MASSDVPRATEKTSSDVFISGSTGTAGAVPVCPSRQTSPNRDASVSRFIVVMGVSGTGKSTLGAALSRALCVPFIDGDDLHPAANVAKMSRGEPLNDADRQPWLATIRQTAIACVREQLGVDHGKRTKTGRRPGLIVACSALKKAYRVVLRGQGERSASDALLLPTYFVYLKGDRDVLMTRMLNREGHYMKAGMLESQLNALESPEGELGVVTVSVDMSTEEQVRRVVEMFDSQGC